MNGLTSSQNYNPPISNANTTAPNGAGADLPTLPPLNTSSPQLNKTNNNKRPTEQQQQAPHERWMSAEEEKLAR